MKRLSFPYHLFDTVEHRAWKRDRELRQRIPVSERWRGSIGLALMWQNVDADFECVGDQIFYGNDNLTWLCLRDIPAGHFPGCPVRDRRDVNLASTTKATLCHGMPELKFTGSGSQTWDFRKMPFDNADLRRGSKVILQREASGDTLNSQQHRREFAIFNRLSAAMTRHAFYGCDRDGSWARPAWANRRKLKYPMQFISPDRWFPTPYIGYRDAEPASSALSSALRTHATRKCPAIKLKFRPGVTFFAAETIDPTSCGEAVDLIWRCESLESFIWPDLQAAVLPPLQNTRWDGLRVSIKNIDVNAEVNDPRFAKPQAFDRIINAAEQDQQRPSPRHVETA